MSKIKNLKDTNPKDLKGKSYRGFTLIELLVVVSIIGALATLVLVSFTGSQKQARDTQRKSDLRQYQTALEQFANNNPSGFYPSRTDNIGASASTTLCTDLGISSCPEDPREQTSTYRYQSNGITPGAAEATQYVLWDSLESSDVYWVNCSTGQSGEIDNSAWSNPTDGNCPL